MLGQPLLNVRTLHPLIHSIMNYVTVNDCANMLLACGASPIMADDALEVEEITTQCQGLVLNIGTLNTRTIEAMELAGRRANALGHPVILDPVGVGASHFRTETAQRLLSKVSFTVIRGNVSEIKVLTLGSGATQGVDANPSDRVTDDTLKSTVDLAIKLSSRTGAIVVITGAVDIITDSETVYLSHNGHSLMSQITGTGCMLSAIIGAYVTANPTDKLNAVVSAVCALGLCGEMAAQRTHDSLGGTGSFKMHLLDAMSNLSETTLKEGSRYERYA